MNQHQTAVPPEGIIAPQGQEREDLYLRILADARKSRVYGDIAEDVAAETWLLAQSRGYYVYNMLREAARNLGLWRQAKETELSVCLLSEDTDPETGAILAERAEAVRLAVLQLSPRLQAVIRLRYFEDMTLEKIAEKLGISVASVHSRLNKAISALRLMLANYAPPIRRNPVHVADLPLFAGR